MLYIVSDLLHIGSHIRCNVLFLITWCPSFSLFAMLFNTRAMLLPIQAVLTKYMAILALSYITALENI